MDRSRAPKNITGVQWIRSRLHRYYFIGVAWACLVAVTLVAIAAGKLFASHTQDAHLRVYLKDRTMSVATLLARVGQ